MSRFKLTIEYAGTRYSGWQIQQNARTIEGELARAVRELTRLDDFELYGAGRTDAGVHALAQVAHLDLKSSAAPETLRSGINDELPADIHVRQVEAVRHRFHARRSAEARSYLYQVSTRRTAFAKPFVWWVKEPLEVCAMERAAARFTGFHDFAGFTVDADAQDSTRVLVDRVEVRAEGALILVRIMGSHFLWRMARRMVGVLVEVGRGSLDGHDVARLLQDGSNDAARWTAPASGLFLERVFYPGDTRDFPLRAPTPVP